MESEDNLPIRVVLLDRDDVARSRSVARFEQISALEVVADVTEAAEAVRLARELHPDAVLVESQRQDQLVEAISLLSSLPEVERPAVVAYLEIIQRATWPDARAAGADDVLLQELPPPSLERELRSIVKHVRSIRA